MPEALLTPAQAAKSLEGYGVHRTPDAIRWALRNGKLPGKKVGGRWFAIAGEILPHYLKERG